MEKYQYTVKFFSSKDDAKKTAIVQKIKETLKPFLENGTIEAYKDAIQVVAVDVGEIYSIGD